MPITHTFQSARGDNSDPGAIQPSQWNADHDLGEGLLSLLDLVAPSPNTIFTLDGSGNPILKPLTDLVTIDNANFVGVPTAPTADATTNTTQLATTEFVQAVVALLVDSSPAALNTLNELAAALGNDANFATTMTNALALKAALASPNFTGTPTAPTVAGTTDSSTTLSTTAFVQAVAATKALQPGGLLLSLDGSAPSGYVELDGATITGGVATYPAVAARYPWMKVNANADLALPDARGRFPRFWAHGSANDPDRASRTARAGDSTTGDNPATYQSHAMQQHQHDTDSGSFIMSGGATAAAGSGGTTWHSNTKSGNISSGANTTTETRPSNINISLWMKMG